MNPSIIYQDNNIVAVNKPAGVAVHKGVAEKGRNIGRLAGGKVSGNKKKWGMNRNFGRGLFIGWTKTLPAFWLWPETKKLLSF